MAIHKKTLVIQPPGSDRDALLTLLYGNGHQPDIADTIPAAETFLRDATAKGSRYDVIFLSDFPIDDMRNLVSTLSADPVQYAADIIACSEDIRMWDNLSSPYFSFMRRSAAGWDIRTMLHSFFPIKRLA